MNAGGLSAFVTLLAYVDGAWVPAGYRYLGLEHIGSVAYSALATKAPGVLFDARENTITRAYALRANGQHYMITDIVPNGRRYSAITCAAVTITACQLQRPTTNGKDAHNRPIAGTPTIMDFEAILAEAYINWRQERPHAELERGMILTAPKAIALRSGDIVVADGVRYAVRECHTAGQWHNDYAITWLGEA